MVNDERCSNSEFGELIWKNVFFTATVYCIVGLKNKKLVLTFFASSGVVGHS